MIDEIVLKSCGSEGSVPATKSRRLRVAVRAKESQVFKAMVLAIAIDVIQLENKWSVIPPRFQTTDGTLVLQQALFENAIFKIFAVQQGAVDDHVF